MVNDTSKRRFSQRALASALGISPARVAALKKRGMPVTSAPAAQRWRAAFVAPYMKSTSARRAARPAAEDADELGMADLIIAAALFADRHGMEVYGPMLVHLVCACLDDGAVERAFRDEVMPESVDDTWDEMYEAYAAMHLR